MIYLMKTMKFDHILPAFHTLSEISTKLRITTVLIDFFSYNRLPRDMIDVDDNDSVNS